jgi:lipopolysaccharide export system permease protein
MIIDRYIARVILNGTLMTLMVFGALFAFMDFVRSLDSVGTHNYGMPQALLYVLLNLPQRLYQIFPSSMLVGGLLSLGSLASNSELVVMRAAGISIARIVRATLQAGFILVVIVVLLGEFVAPIAVSKAKSLQAQWLNERVLLSYGKDIWSKDGNSFVHIGNVLPDAQLRDVSVYDLNQQRELVRTTHADQVQYNDGQWYMTGVVQSHVSTKGVIVTRSQHVTRPAMVRPELFEVLALEPSDMSASELLDYSGYLNQNDLESDSFRLAFWVKVFTPLTCMGMLLLTIPLVLSSSARSGGVGQRIMIGVLVGVGFFIFNRAFSQFGIIYGLYPVLSAALPSILVIFTAILMAKRVR